MICDCGDPVNDGQNHSRCYLIASLEDERDYGAEPDPSDRYDDAYVPGGGW